MSLAKIKLRVGDSEIEIDSRDFYVDNQTIGKVIETFLPFYKKVARGSYRILMNLLLRKTTLLIHSKMQRLMNQNLVSQFLYQ